MAFSFAVHLFVRLFACWLNIWRLECLFRPEERREESLCHGVVETSRYGGIPIPTLVYLSYTLLMFFFLFHSLFQYIFYLYPIIIIGDRLVCLFFAFFLAAYHAFYICLGPHYYCCISCSQVTITVYFFFFYISQFPQFHYSIHRSFYISVH